MKIKSILSILLISVSFIGFSQELENDRNWDNTMYTGNKFSYGTSGSWKHSAEFQTRYNTDLSNLEQWHIEYAATYLKNENWEVVPDFRFTRKPSRYEYRPGIGLIYKQIWLEKKAQLVHQIKYQYDIKSEINNSQGIRYAIFYNKVINRELILSALAGGLFEFGEDWSGFLGLRTGLAAAYVFNEKHSVNLGYFYGLINKKTNDYTNLGIFSLQLIINIGKPYDYVPAKYYSF